MAAAITITIVVHDTAVHTNAIGGDAILTLTMHSVGVSRQILTCVDGIVAISRTQVTRRVRRTRVRRARDRGHDASEAAAAAAAAVAQAV